MSGRIKIANGVAAIWADAADDEPFTSPLSNLPRVKFHSQLNYIRAVSTVVATVSLPLVNTVFLRSASYNITPGGHGQNGQPFVLGHATVQGVKVAFTGSICVQLPTNQYGVVGYGRFLSIGADETNVYLHEYTQLYGSASPIDTYAAIDIDVTCFITDKILSAA